MKWLFIFALALLFNPTFAQTAEDDFRLRDNSGRSYSLRGSTDRAWIVFIAFQQHSNVLAVLERANALKERLGSNGYVYLVHVGATDRAKNRTILKGRRLVILEDTFEAVSRTLGFERTGDVTVFHTVQRGQDPKREMTANALKNSELNLILRHLKVEELSLFEKLRFAWTNKFKRWDHPPRRLAYELNPRIPMQWNDEVAQAFHHSCVECHASLPHVDFFKNDKALKGWAQMNRMVVRTMRMPPSGAEPDARYSRCGQVHLATNEQDLHDFKLVYNWLEQGSPMPVNWKGNLLAKVAKEETKATAEKTKAPNLVWKTAQEHRIPATGLLEYRYEKIAGPLPKDLWVTGFFAHYNSRVTEHVSLIQMNELPPDMAELSRNTSENAGLSSRKFRRYDHGKQDVFTTFSQNRVPQKFPAHTAIFLPKGSYVIAEVHYNPSGREETNRVQIDVLTEENKEEQSRLKPIQRLSLPRKEFEIAAGDRNFQVNRKWKLEKPVLVLGAWTHAHYRAVATSIFAKKPTGERVAICNVPYHRFKFLTSAGLGDPIALPAGAEIQSKIWYDNSDLNPANPDPKRAVRNGFQTDKEEMDLVRLLYVEGESSNLSK